MRKRKRKGRGESVELQVFRHLVDGEIPEGVAVHMRKIDRDVEGEELLRLVASTGCDPDSLDCDVLNAIASLRGVMTIAGESYLCIDRDDGDRFDVGTFDRLMCKAGIKRFFRWPEPEEYGDLGIAAHRGRSGGRIERGYVVLVREIEPGLRTRNAIALDSPGAA